MVHRISHLVFGRWVSQISSMKTVWDPSKYLFNFQQSDCCMMPLRQASKVSKDGKHFLDNKKKGRTKKQNLLGIVIWYNLFIGWLGLSWWAVLSAGNPEKKTAFPLRRPFITTPRTELLMNSSVNKTCWSDNLSNMKKGIRKTHYPLGCQNTATADNSA